MRRRKCESSYQNFIFARAGRHVVSVLMSIRSRPTSLLLLGLLLGLSLSLADRVFAQHTVPAAATSTTAAASTAAASTTASATAAATDGLLPLEDARLFADVMQRVHENYVDATDDHKLMQAAIRGMVESLDSHSTLLSTDEFEDMQVSTSGAYAGIGVEVAPSKNGVSVVRRMPGSPAERAGIHSGDVIVQIDGVAVSPTDVDEAIGRMRGPEGSVIRLAVQRAGAPGLLEFQIRRAHVQLQSVEAELLTPDYGYLRINSFTDTTATELERAVARLEHTRSVPLRGFVVDLRNNPGGVLDAAVQVADDFLDHGTIVSAKGRAEDANFRIEARPGDISHGAKLVVLVNGGSASASEILAAALHDNQRARLVGHRTYGKGTVQTIMPLADGMALKLTTSRYYTPAGISINGVGIVPDVPLSTAEEPPADMDASSSEGAAAAPTLAQRDNEVAVALATLGGGPGAVAEATPLPAPLSR
jgi:carboxyl-terminal processing protease